MAKAKQKKKFDWEKWSKKGIKQVIHCETEAELLALKEILHRKGFKWRHGEAYLDKNVCPFNEYKDKTCLTNGGQYTDINWFNRHGYEIYKFSMYDFD